MRLSSSSIVAHVYAGVPNAREAKTYYLFMINKAREVISDQLLAWLRTVPKVVLAYQRELDAHN